MIYRSGTVRGREAMAFWPDHREDLREDLNPALLPDSALETRTRAADGMTLADVQDLTPLTRWEGAIRDAEGFFRDAERCVRAGWCVVMKLDALYVRGDGSLCFIALPYSEPSVGSAEAVRRYLKDPNDFDSFLPHCPLEGPGEDGQDGGFFRQMRGDEGEMSPFFGKKTTDEAIDMFPPEEEAPPVAPTPDGPLTEEAAEEPPAGVFGGLVEEDPEEDGMPGFFQPPQSQPEPPAPQDREAARNKVTTAFEMFSEALQTFLQTDAAKTSGTEQMPGAATGGKHESDFTFRVTGVEAAPQPEIPAAPVAENPVTPEPQDNAGSFEDVMSFFEDVMKQNDEP